jgi:hypothetical protein
VAAKCLLQVREYLNSPPDIEGGHLTAGRHIYITFLHDAGVTTGLDFSGAIGRLRESMATVPQLAQAIRQGHLEEAAVQMGRIAEKESQAYAELSRVVGDPG